MYRSKIYGWLFISLFLLPALPGLAQRDNIHLLKNNKPAAPLFNEYVRKGEIVNFETLQTSLLLADKPQHIDLGFQFENRNWVIELEQSDIFSNSFFIMTASEPGARLAYTSQALHYRGKVQNKPGSFAAVSILPDQVIAVIADENGNINIGAINTPGGRLAHEHIIYREQYLLIRNNFECATRDDYNVFTDNPVPSYNSTASTSGLVNDEPVDIYFEADHQIYLNNSSGIENAADYVASLFNVVNGLFITDSINARISAIKIWDIPDPYILYNDRVAVLQAFSSNMSTGFPGDLAHFLTQRNLGGGVASLDVLCKSNNARTGVTTALSNTLVPFPTYSYNVFSLAHELGHNFGSPHTHSCTWPGGAIDNCSIPEGTCPPGNAPVNGGTLMSYCQETAYGVNLSHGFGPLPGALIRSKLRGNTCIYPALYFDVVQQIAREENADAGDDCLKYKLYTVNLKISTPPLQPVAITLLPTAVSPGMEIGVNKDVEIISPLGFTIDSFHLSEPVVFKVYNDAIAEPIERLEINFDFNANGANVVKMFNATKCTVIVLSDDARPDSIPNQLLYYESFDSITSGTGAWTQRILYGETSSNRWIVKNTAGADFQGNAAFISDDGNEPAYNNDSTIVRLESPSINAAGFFNISVGCFIKCPGEYYFDAAANQIVLADFGKIVYSIDNGSTWLVLRNELYNIPNKVFQTSSLPAIANNSTQLKIGFEWYNNNSGTNSIPFVIDSIVIKGTSAAAIQSAEHSNNLQEAYIGPNQIVHFFNPATGNIMATIENKSSYEMGCTTVEIIRTGTAATPAWGILAGGMISDKVYRITSSNSDNAAPYTVKLYYTNEEINGWLSATGNNMDDIRIVKATGEPGLPLFSSLDTNNNFAATQHRILSATFTGVSPTATYAIMKPYGPAGCTVNTFNYSTDITGSAYQWQVNSGTGYSDLTDDAVYNNSNTAGLQVILPPAVLFGNRYRCAITTATGIVFSNEFILKSGNNWTGTVSNQWENGLNWSCGFVPDENSDVIINSGTDFPPLLNTNTAIRSITIAPGAIVTIKNGAVLTINH